MSMALYIQPGTQRPSGKPAANIDATRGGNSTHVRTAIDAGVNLIRVKKWRWQDCWKKHKIFAAPCDVQRIEEGLRIEGWRQWEKDETCWLPEIEVGV